MPLYPSRIGIIGLKFKIAWMLSGRLEMSKNTPEVNINVILINGIKCVKSGTNGTDAASQVLIPKFNDICIQMINIRDGIEMLPIGISKNNKNTIKIPMANRNLIL
ncbi:hypothetical protein NBRC116591_16220 [Sessilibacter corallicola]|uniref:Uncharacterized protein n=1 Tax=Sessilibacter corallicola TaxID=2904075 RepID=A0ABQ0A842_9GAMM